MTCCLFYSLETLLTSSEGIALAFESTSWMRGYRWPVFQLIMYGRFLGDYRGPQNRIETETVQNMSIQSSAYCDLPVRQFAESLNNPRNGFNCRNGSSHSSRLRQAALGAHGQPPSGNLPPTLRCAERMNRDQQSIGHRIRSGPTLDSG